MGFLLTLLLIQDTAYAAGFQTNRDLELQHIRILDELGEDRSARTQAVAEIMGVQHDIREAQDAIKPTLEDVVKEMRVLNLTMAAATAAIAAQTNSVAAMLDMISDAVVSLLPVLAAIFLGSKTPLGKRLLNGRKGES